MKKWHKVLLKILLVIIDKVLKKEEFDTIESLSISRPKQVIFLKNAADLIQYANSLPGYEVTGGELFRTEEQQAIYRAKGLSKARVSRHQQRLAIDLNVFVNGVYQKEAKAYEPLAIYWKKLHKDNVAGFDWGWDANHFEMKP